MTGLELLKHYSTCQYMIPFEQDPQLYWNGPKGDQTFRTFRHLTLPLSVTVPMAYLDKGNKKDKAGWQMAIYVGDQELIEKSPLRMNPPFDNITDTNKAYYGLYLNLAAYLAGGSVQSLSIVLPQQSSKKVSIKYLPGLAELMCAHLEESLRNKKPTGQTVMRL